MKGKISRPQKPYLGQREIDLIMRMNTNLLMEVWQLRDRLAITEQLLMEKSVLSSDEIDSYSPSPELNATLESLRSEMIERVVDSADDSGYSVESLVKKVRAG